MPKLNHHNLIIAATGEFDMVKVSYSQDSNKKYTFVCRKTVGIQPEDLAIVADATASRPMKKDEVQIVQVRAVKDFTLKDAAALPMNVECIIDKVQQYLPESFDAYISALTKKVKDHQAKGHKINPKILTMVCKSKLEK